MSGTTGALRLARLLVRPNQLRRRSDRFESCVILLLAVVFLAAVAAAPWLGERLYDSKRAEAAQLHPAMAVLTQAGPSGDYMTSAGQAAARWRAPDGRQHKGILTTMTAPGILNAPAGARVKVWLTAAGQPETPPASAAETVFSSVIMAIGMVFGAAVPVVMCYWVCRLVLDRCRLAAWASEWSLTGPRWTTRL
jgi:hypothetical protein